MYKVSVIIPVYNAERYLEKCVNSVLAQTLREIEIILVDDGSTDRSPELCDEFSNCLNIRVIHQKNAGVSMARNAGMEIAEGEYIGFVDSDDYIAEDMYEKLYQKACEHDLDVILGNFQIVKDGVKLSDGVIQLPADRIIKKEEIREILVRPDKQRVTWFAWKSIFRRDMLQTNQVVFQSGMLGEDSLFSLDAMLYAESMYFIDSPFYSYEENPDSQMRTPHKKDMLGKLNNLYEAKLDVYEKHGIHNAQEFIAEYTMAHSLPLLFYNEWRYKRKLREKMSVYRRIRNSSMVRDMFDVLPIPKITAKVHFLTVLLELRCYFLLALLTN